jgi:23S rRNA pseudouridine2604 synthase
MDQNGTRINKYLSELGICSRREADKWIEAGRVTINGKRPEPGTRVTRRSKVRVDGRVVSEPDEPDVYLALNKPPGIVCTTDESDRNNIVEYVNYPKRVFPIGRLDKPSEGLIFMTSDGDIVNKILRAGNEHEKEYEVTVDKQVTPAFIDQMSSGVPIMGTRTKKCKVEMITPHSFRITLVQGMNRQIRRMCEHFEYDVKKLKRTRIMNVKLDVPPGQWRELTESELGEILRMTHDSSKTQGAKKATPSSSKSNSKPAGNKKKPVGFSRKPGSSKKPSFKSSNRDSSARKKNTKKGRRGPR